MHHRVTDLTGRKFGSLTVTSYAGSTGKKSLWAAECDCGVSKTLDTSDLKRAKSCGCLTRLLVSESRRTHGMTGHPAYAVWRSMLDRCRLPTHQAWHNYGARGIRVCERWHAFENFWADMGPTYQPGLTLDRSDNEEGYSPGNCRWVSHKDQARNTRRSRVIETPLGRMTVAELSDRTGIGQTTLLYRLSRGVTGEDLLWPPDLRNRFTIS